MMPSLTLDNKVIPEGTDSNKECASTRPNAEREASSSLFTELNSEQSEAVLQTEGSLLIIAGAGTGKTHVITSRILHLLLNKKIPAQQILALTFTEKAVQEMLDRVDKNMPLSYEEITLKTFHGFCEAILRERGLEIGIDPSYRLLDQTQQWVFLKKHLFSFELDYYRPLGNPNKFLFTLLNHFSRLKDEDISPESYLEYAQELRQKLKSSAGDSEEKIALEEAVKTLEIAKAYSTYQRLMQEENLLDFGDLQYYALRLFEKRPSVLQEYQNRYQYILVDEFQDTNYSQNKLVTLLAQKHRNIAVVGDDDQAIYKWRGASLSNILNFEKTFPESKKVVLVENYRSRQEILDLSYAVIQNNNPYRLEAKENINKRLKAMRVDAKGGETQAGVGAQGEGEVGAGDAFGTGTDVSYRAGSPIQSWHFTSYLKEARAVAAKIADDVLKSNGELGYKDFAILVRANQLAQPFIEALKEAEIPFNVRSQEGLLGFEEIKDLAALLRFLVNPYDDIACFRILSLPIFNIPMRELLDLTAKAKKAGYEPLFKYLRVILQKDSDQESLPGLDDTSTFGPIYNLLNDLLDFSKRENVNRVLGEFLNVSGYIKDLTQNDTLVNAEKIQHIAQFLESAAGFGNESHESSLRAFLEYLQLLEQAEQAIEPLPVAEGDSVSILTLHAAKGLEFKVVFMPSLVAQRFPSIHRRDPIEIPLALVREELPVVDQHLYEERRLFYVGCTRARDQLILSYSDFYEGRKKWKISKFLEEAKAGGKVQEMDFTANDSGSNVLLVSDQNDRLHEGLEAEVEIPSNLNKNLLFVPEIKVNQLSYSQLDTFSTCPLKYKFRYLFQLPSPSAHAANFGSSIHETLNDFYTQLKKGTEPSMDLLHQLYEKQWIVEGYDSKGHEQARKKQGLEVLERFYQKESTPHFIFPAYLERNFRLKIGEFTFTGRIDRIDKLPDGTYEVVDYKTGSSKRDSDLTKDLQLSLYALACKEIFRLPVSKLSLYFLEDVTKASTTRSAQHLADVKEEFIGLSRELLQSGFKPTPGFHCKFCEYRVLCHAAE